MAYPHLAYTAQLKDGPIFYAAGYEFTRKPGGSLVASSNTVTLRPVPEGVNGGDFGHSVYISSGVGTAEAVVITGGTAVSGAASGTITFICAHTHTGSWKITSASGGIQEAINVATNGSTIMLPPGNTNVYGTIWLYVKSLRITGGNYTIVPNAGTLILPQTAGMDVFHTFLVNGAIFENFGILNAVKQTAGNSFVEEQSSDIVWRYIRTQNDWNSINQISGGGDQIDHCRFSGFQNIALTINTALADAGGATVTNSIFDGSDYVYAAILHTNGGGTQISGNGFHCFAQYGVLHQPAGQSSQLQITTNLFDGPYGIAIMLQPLGGEWDHYIITGNVFSNFANDGGTVPFHGAFGYEAINVFSTDARHGVIESNSFQPWYATGNPNTNLASILVNGKNWLIQGNLYNNGATGIQAVGAAELTIGSGNRMNNVTTYNTYLATASGGYSVTLNDPGFSIPYAILTVITITDGSVAYCPDGQATSPTDSTLIGGGSGALAVRIAGVWRTASGTGGGPLTITGTQDSSNTSFTTSGTVGKLFRNGALLAPTIDYTAVGTAVTMAIPPAAPDILLAFSV